MGTLVRILSLLALLTLLATPASARPATRPAEARDVGKAVVIVLDGTVDEFMLRSVRDRFAEARELGAEAVILRIDTYGGLVTAGLEISRFVKQQDLPTLAFVDEKAISAGSMIALACDEIAMEPASMIGDSGVIAMAPGGGGPQTLGETERAKAESPVLADFADSARRNGYSELLARSFVRADLVVYAVENTRTGERRMVDADGYERLVDGGPFASEETDWQPVPDVPVPLDDADSILTMTNLVAERVGLSVGTYDSPQEYAERNGMAVVATLTPGAGERLVGFLGGFAVRGLLMTVLLFSVYAAFSTPGTGVPEAVAAVAAMVVFGVPFLTGFAQWYEVLLVLIGFVLLAVELFVIPGFGIFGITGLLAIVLGFAGTFVAPILPRGLPAGFGVNWDDLLAGLLTAVLGMLASLGLWFWLSRYLDTLPFARGLVLGPDEPSEEEAARSAAWPTVGTGGEAVTDLYPGGTARFAITDAPGDTANIDVVCDRGFVPAGTPVSVVEAAGNRIVVRPDADADAAGVS